jgi:hypothetical protein
VRAFLVIVIVVLCWLALIGEIIGTATHDDSLKISVAFHRLIGRQP